MFLSIVIPVYNTKPYLASCIESVLAQAFSDYELILVDDGSTDGSGRLCDEYARRDSRIHVIHQENKGLSMARNAGIDTATGEYILFLDSDDYLLHDQAIRFIYKASESKPDAICFPYIRANGEGEYKPKSCLIKSGPATLRKMIKTNQYTCSACCSVIKREFINRYNLRFVSEQLSEDILWIAAITLKAERFAFIPSPLYGYRARAGSITTQNTQRHIEDLLSINQQLFELIEGQNLTEERKEEYLSYVAYQYCTLLINIRRAENMDYINTIKQYKWILSHHLNPAVKLVWAVEHVIGLRATSWFLLQGYRLAYLLAQRDR